MKTLINSTLIILYFSLLSCSNSNEDINNSREDINSNQNDLESLPKDGGGVQKANILGSTNAIYGHYIYTPSNYSNNSPNYPLLVYLHGSGQVGNSQTNPDELKKVIITGVTKLIDQKKWSPKFPMIVASPQLTSGSWNADDLHSFISYLIANYNINVNRIYITGFSLGAFGCYNYISKYGDESYAAAIVPIAGGGNTNSGSKFTNTAVWAFHGDIDTTVSKNGSIGMINAINAANPKTRAKLTIYPGIDHGSDNRTFDGSGMGTESSDYDAFNMTIYDWMFLYEK
ncbi:dienelactone hydrolase family protein [Confluentibacter sediminis]|uniref:carboxylesterase family protein n=1 Tax=Confluentibacter sediminis TaxID=2219045 RepID=UPI000DAC6055|nr:dienelactone hydrolase family protein [Confluentibacter sediminis]